MQNFIIIVLFALFNLLLLPLITIQYSFLIFGALIMVENPYEEIKIYFLILLLFLFMRILILPIFYLILKNKSLICTKFFKLLKNNNIFTILLLLSLIIVDFLSAYLYCKYHLFSEIKLTLVNYTKYIFLLGYCLGGYGLFFAYLSLLFYTRIIEEKFRQRGFFNIIISILFLIMFVPITIILLDVFI